MTPAELIRSVKGLVGTVVTTGAIRPGYAIALSNMRSYNDRHGLHAVEYRIFNASLVEAGRDAVIAHARKERYDWVLQIDADAGPFPENSLERVLHHAYIGYPGFDVIGAYCQLKGGPNLPTIDTGSGTWEEHYPGEGFLPVIRTGGHFLLTRTRIFDLFGPPWFRTRRTVRSLDAMLEVDSMARCALNGRNPLRDHPEWETLLAHAAKVSGSESSVGEDSGFCDRAKAVGVAIGVDTDLVVGHIDERAILPGDFVEAVKKGKAYERAALGVMR